MHCERRTLWHLISKLSIQIARRDASMDTELARTFLTVIARGSFVRAAEHLHLTQSTVSARIASLERALGCRLFVRNRGGTHPTPEGRRFERHAAELVHAVERARQALGVARAYPQELIVGARFGLWEGLMLDWLAALRSHAPHVAVRAEVGFEESLMQALIEGRLDLGVMYTPEHRPGLTVQRLFEETLVLVTSGARDAEPPGPGYVYVDWGPEFGRQHQADFPDFGGAGITVNIGWLGLRHILAHGGSGYFPERLVADKLAAGRLVRLDGAPRFALPVHAVHASAVAAEPTLRAALALLAGRAARLPAQGSMSSNRTLDR
jgi:LysR family transcriptional regulator, flagellar master operon regulator